MAIPTIDLMEITPKFIKDHIFLLLLMGDTALTGALNFATGSNFIGIVGYIISFVFGSLANLATGLNVNFAVHTWHIFLLVLLFQFGIAKMIYHMLLNRHGSSMRAGG